MAPTTCGCDAAIWQPSRTSTSRTGPLRTSWCAASCMCAMRFPCTPTCALAHAWWRSVPHCNTQAARHLCWKNEHINAVRPTPVCAQIGAKAGHPLHGAMLHAGGRRSAGKQAVVNRRLDKPADGASILRCIPSSARACVRLSEPLVLMQACRTDMPVKLRHVPPSYCGLAQ